MFKFQKNKVKPRTKNNQKEIYILNPAEDVLKIPEDLFYKIDISNFSGNYFKKNLWRSFRSWTRKEKIEKGKTIKF